MKIKLAFFLVLAILVLAKFTYDNFKQPFKSGEHVPVFSLPDLGGNIVQLDNFRGSPVIVHFWGTWCPTCVAEMPSLENFARAHPEVIILAISEDEDADRVNKFFEGHAPSFKVLFDGGGRIADVYNNYKLPQSYLVDKDGGFIHHFSGDVSWNDPNARDAILALFQKSPKNTK